MRPVGRHTSERASAIEAAPRPSVRRTLVLSLFIALSIVAWGVLVYEAIDFGRQARAGDSTMWKWLVVAAVGAVLCLFLTMVLAGRLVGHLRGRPVTPPRLPGGRRAAR
jgi:RsiW-degrading membrane proteinase PrsW (M82 family)